MAEKNIIVTPSGTAYVEEAARRIAERLQSTDGRVAICLTGGSTPKTIYQRLAREPFSTSIAWERTHWFWGDDRFVPLDHDDSNAKMAFEAFLNHVPIPPENIHPINTGEATPEKAAQLYQTELTRFYGNDQLNPEKPLFDLVMMGLGSDGHTASLFPGSPELQEENKWVTSVEVAGLAPFVPRITLTFPALASTREMVFFVRGQDKREIFERILSGEDLPANRAYATGEQNWMVDSDVADR